MAMWNGAMRDPIMRGWMDTEVIASIHEIQIYITVAVQFSRWNI